MSKFQTAFLFFTLNSNNLEPGENPQFFGQLKSGDVELDLSFNRLVYDHDFNAFLTAQDKCEGDPGYDSIFDLYVDNCINVGDAGILLGNAPDWPDTPTEGDIDVTDVVGTTSFLTTTAGDSALLSFNPSEKEVEVGEDTTVLLDVAPCCNSAMNAVDFTLSFSPTLIQVNDVLIGQLPLVVNKTVDNSQGTVRFMVGIPGSVTETVTVAHLSFKAISSTSGAIITPTHFAVAGPSGLFSTTTTQSMTVKTKSSGSCGGGYCLYFPVIFKDSSPP